MQKPRPTADLRFVFHPESDIGYQHFDGSHEAPFGATATSMTRANAWWLAESALLAYWDAPDAIRRFAGAGLSADFVEVADTQAYVAWNTAAILVSFRGTQPGRIGDIVDDAVAVLVPWTHGLVHLGFREALNRVWPKLIGPIERLAATRSVWFGGHSLGAALATLAADRYPKSAGVCTLGSPRVGDRIFTATFDARFGARSLRYVNDTDIVTHVPTPFPLPYAHVNVLRHITSDGRVTEQTPTLAHLVPDVFGNVDHLKQVMDALRGGTLTVAPDFLLDHMPRAYTVDIWNDFDGHRNDDVPGTR